MKKKLIIVGVAVVAAAAALLFFPRYALVGILCALVGWVGHYMYVKPQA